jgi:hypothetical protein
MPAFSITTSLLVGGVVVIAAVALVTSLVRRATARSIATRELRYGAVSRQWLMHHQSID